MALIPSFARASLVGSCSESNSSFIFTGALGSKAGVVKAIREVTLWN